MQRNPRVLVRKGTWQSICDARKTLLVRIDDRIFAKFRPGIELTIESGSLRLCRCEIIAIRRYPTLEDLLQTEDLERIAHGSHLQAETYLSGLYQHVPSTHTFVVLELKLLRIGGLRVSTG